MMTLRPLESRASEAFFNSSAAGQTRGKKKNTADNAKAHVAFKGNDLAF
jgi:hypothetical protein